MKRKQTFSNHRISNKKLTKLVLTVLVALGVMVFESCQAHKNKSPNNQVETPKALSNVNVISVYDGDTFKVNIPCEMEVFCEAVSVRVRGVDTPEIKGKTEREKELAQKAKKFTQAFLKKTPISLTNCGRDKYFRLLCNVQNSTGKDLAQELIKADLGYAYQGGTKSTKYQ